MLETPQQLPTSFSPGLTAFSCKLASLAVKTERGKIYDQLVVPYSRLITEDFLNSNSCHALLELLTIWRIPRFGSSLATVKLSWNNEYIQRKKISSQLEAVLKLNSCLDNSLPGLECSYDEQSANYIIKFVYFPHPGYYDKIVTQVSQLCLIFYDELLPLPGENEFSLLLSQQSEQLTGEDSNDTGGQNWRTELLENEQRIDNTSELNLKIITFKKEDETQLATQLNQNGTVSIVELQNYLLGNTRGDTLSEKEAHSPKKFIKRAPKNWDEILECSRVEQSLMWEEALNLFRLRMTSKLKHRNLATYYSKSELDDAEKYSQRNYLNEQNVSHLAVYEEFYTGTNLQQCSLDSISPSVIYLIGKQILSAYYFLKRVSCIHMDAKPENIVIQLNSPDSREMVKLIDYQSMTNLDSVGEREPLNKRKKKMTRSIYGKSFRELKLQDTYSKNLDLYGLSKVFQKLLGMDRKSNPIESRLDSERDYTILCSKITSKFVEAEQIPIREDLQIQSWIRFYNSVFEEYEANRES